MKENKEYNKINLKSKIEEQIAYLLKNGDKWATELKLHKMLYFAQKVAFIYFLSEEKELKLLFKEELSAWKYGAVCKYFRDNLKKIKDFPFQEFLIKEYSSGENLNDEEKRILDITNNQYKNIGIFKLCDLNHREESWKNARKLGNDEFILWSDLEKDAKKELDFEGSFGIDTYYEKE